MRTIYHATVASCFLFVLLTGCNSLPAGDVRQLRSIASSSSPAPSRQSTIILLRGWRDLWSDGIDQLAGKLKAEGIDAVVFKQSQSSDVGDALVDAAKAKSLGTPVVLIGFSYGADDSIANARRLNDVGQPVDLLILIDPVTPAPIPQNVKRCVNFYQSNGVWDTFPWLRGMPVWPEQKEFADRVVNINLRDREDLLDGDTSHKTIAGSEKVHAAIIEEIRRAGTARRTDTMKPGE